MPWGLFAVDRRKTEIVNHGDSSGTEPAVAEALGATLPTDGCNLVTQRDYVIRRLPDEAKRC
jgi:hypothetical protein